MRKCPSCGGIGGHGGLGLMPNLERCEPIWMRCQNCQGTGRVTPAEADAIRRAKRRGLAARRSRIRRGRSLRDEARRLGISVVRVSQRERGIVAAWSGP